MNERDRLEHILTQLDLPQGQWVVSGSGVLVLHGIERSRPMGDLDIFVATRLWFSLLNQSIAAPTPPDGAGERASLWSVWTTDPNDRARCVDPPYLFREVYGLEVNVFFNWRRRGIGDIDVAFWMANAEYVSGWPCIPLQFLLDWKVEVGRAKDRDDIPVLQRHLEGRS